MRTAVRVAVSFALVASIGAIAWAQGAAKPSSHEQVARELFQVSGGTAMAEQGGDAMLAAMLTQNHELAPYRDVIRAWTKRVYSEGDFEGEVAAIYMKHFSEEELSGLLAFYKTPLGQKTIRELPAVMQEAAQLGGRRAQERMPELLEMMKKAEAERAPAKK